MQISANLVHFFISYAVAFLAFALIGKWYVWPNIKDRPLKAALSPLLLYACLRVNGLMFVMPGLVSPELPAPVCEAHPIPPRTKGSISRRPALLTMPMSKPSPSAGSKRLKVNVGALS